MRCIDERNDLAGKVVLVRAGLNIPMRDGVVVDDFRIRKALPTLRFLQEQGAKTIVIAHIGRDPKESLRGVADALATHIAVTFTKREALNVESMEDGETVLLENLRQDPREIANADSLAQELAQFADLFVQDAFSVCHREHASIVGIPKYLESYGGLLLKAEVSVLTRALQPEHPSLFILGGAKFATKEPLIRKFLDVYDSVFIGGALQNEVLAASGIAVGQSVIEDGAVPAEILDHPNLQGIDDVVVERSDKSTENVQKDAVGNTDTIVDIGERTVDSLIDTLEDGAYKTILWNGPLGWYEKGYSMATTRLAHAIIKSGADTIVGGGDTVAAIQKEGIEEDFGFVSTGGGSMLQFLQNGTLPGIESLGR